MKSALLVIDIQNDYFESANGAFPQFNSGEVAVKIAKHIQSSPAEQLIIFVQHIAPKQAPFFAEDSDGAMLNQSIRHLLADKPVIIKTHADSFLNTNLADVLESHGITQLDICGMMSQNCVTHTALSPQASKYHIRILSELCTAPTLLIHKIAIRALTDRSSERFEVV